MLCLGGPVAHFREGKVFGVVKMATTPPTSQYLNNKLYLKLLEFEQTNRRGNTFSHWTCKLQVAKFEPRAKIATGQLMFQCGCRAWAALFWVGGFKLYARAYPGRVWLEKIKFIKMHKGQPGIILFQTPLPNLFQTPFGNPPKPLPLSS